MAKGESQSSNGLSEAELLSSKHSTSAFACGAHESLNHWLRQYALQNQSNDSARTYVIHRNERVVGYYSISAGSVEREAASTRAAHGLAKHPVPVALIGRLAVDKGEQGHGLGRALLKNALLRIERAADTLGIRAVLVHAIDEEARTFYERFGFERCRDDDMHLMLLLKDLRKSLR